jgi:hypothetical protein
MGGIMSLISNAFGAIGKVFGFLEKKNLENNIRKGYEEEKRADTLEEDKVSEEQMTKAQKKLSEARAKLKAVKKANILDAEKSDEEVKTILENIEDDVERKEKEEEIKAAKDLKKKVDEAKEKVESSKSFNDGDTISFGG